MSRVGTFSSSQIYRLCSFGRGKKDVNNIGKAFDTYVKEKAFEKQLGRPLQLKVNSKATSWGTLVEEQCFEVLDLKYSLVSKDRFYHHEFKDYWSGMPDLITRDIVGDIKCPYTLTSFMELLECMGDFEEFKKQKPMYYWQLVSNSILCNRDTAVLVVYVPYQKDLKRIKELAEHQIDLANTYAWINWAEDEQMPHLPNNTEISDVNLFEFEVPQGDKDFLTQRVELAVEQLKLKTK